MGIAPTRELIRNWLAVEAAEEQALAASQPGQVGQVSEQPFLSPRSSPSEVAVDGGVQETSTAASPTHPSSKSRLEPVLRQQGTLEKPPGRRRAGRPRIIAGWFPAVAQTMADGTSLRTALAMCGIRNLGASEIRALYRNLAFKGMYQQARQRFLLESFGKKPSLRARLGRYL